jgi:adenylosuccinate lyase
MINRYEDYNIKHIFSEKRKFQTFFDLELAYAKFLHGKIEHENTNSYSRIEVSDREIDAIKGIEKKTNHEMASVVDFLLEKQKSKYIHLGLTSSDILDSTLSIQMMNASKHLEDCLIEINWRFQNLITDTHGIYITGRTHGQTAEKLLLSEKIKVYHDQLRFLYNKIKSNKKFPIKFRGPVGSYSLNSKLNFCQILFERNVKNLLLKFTNNDPFYKELISEFYRFDDHLSDNISCSQIVPRSYYASYISDVILYFTVLDSFCLDLRLLSQDQIGEFLEPFSSEQKGSSSMPHKKNPIVLENISGLTSLLKSYQHCTIANIYSWNERDISHSSNERIYIEDFFHICCNIAKKILPILSTKNFDFDKIKQNIVESKNINSASELTERIMNSSSSREDIYRDIQEKSNENK